MAGCWFGLGRAGGDPYELFGCEVIVDVTVVEAPLLTFLRGFIVAAAE